MTVDFLLYRLITIYKSAIVHALAAGPADFGLPPVDRNDLEFVLITDTGPIRMPRLTDKLVRATEAPASGLRFVWDDALTGLGLRVTKAGAKSLVLRYVVAGRERMYTLARHPDLSVTAVRDLATDIRGRIARGEDPMDARTNARKAPTVRDLAADYLTQHAERNKRPGSVRDDRAMIENIILPALGGLKVAEVTHRDVATLHASLKAPVVESKVATGSTAYGQLPSLAKAAYRQHTRRLLPFLDLVQQLVCPATSGDRMTALSLLPKSKCQGDGQHLVPPTIPTGIR